MEPVEQQLDSPLDRMPEPPDIVSRLTVLRREQRLLQRLLRLSLEARDASREGGVAVA